MRLKQLYKLQIHCPLPIESFLHLMTFLLEAISLLSNLFTFTMESWISCVKLWMEDLDFQRGRRLRSKWRQSRVPRIDGSGPSDDDEEGRGKSEWSRTSNDWVGEGGGTGDTTWWGRRRKRGRGTTTEMQWGGTWDCDTGVGASSGVLRFRLQSLDGVTWIDGSASSCDMVLLQQVSHFVGSCSFSLPFSRPSFEMTDGGFSPLVIALVSSHLQPFFWSVHFWQQLYSVAPSFTIQSNWPMHLSH